MNKWSQRTFTEPITRRGWPHGNRDVQQLLSLLFVSCVTSPLACPYFFSLCTLRILAPLQQRLTTWFRGCTGEMNVSSSPDSCLAYKTASVPCLESIGQAVHLLFTPFSHPFPGSNLSHWWNWEEDLCVCRAQDLLDFLSFGAWSAH